MFITNCILTGILSQKIRPFDINLESYMPNLSNDRVILKFSNSVLVQKKNGVVTFILNLYIVYELNKWPLNSAYNFPIKIFTWYSQINKNCNQKQLIYNSWGTAFVGEGL